MSKRFKNAAELMDFVSKAKWSEVEEVSQKVYPRPIRTAYPKSSASVSPPTALTNPQVNASYLSQEQHLYFPPQTLPPIPTVIKTAKRPVLQKDIQGVEV